MEWISWADDELANEILNDDEIVDVVLRQEEEKEEDDDEGDSEGEEMAWEFWLMQRVGQHWNWQLPTSVSYTHLPATLLLFFSEVTISDLPNRLNECQSL